MDIEILREGIVELGIPVEMSTVGTSNKRRNRHAREGTVEFPPWLASHRAI